MHKLFWYHKENRMILIRYLHKYVSYSFSFSVHSQKTYWNLLLSIQNIPFRKSKKQVSGPEDCVLHGTHLHWHHFMYPQPNLTKWNITFKAILYKFLTIAPIIFSYSCHHWWLNNRHERRNCLSNSMLQFKKKNSNSKIQWNLEVNFCLRLARSMANKSINTHQNKLVFHFLMIIDLFHFLARVIILCSSK